MTRRGSSDWLFAAALLGLLFTGSADAATDPEPNAPPNIVLIVSDDQGYHDLGCYGNDQIITPHLDRLASQGVRLTQFYVSWPACTPSRGSLLTGRYPQRNGTLSLFRNDAPDYGYQYKPGEYKVTFEHIGGMDVREVLLPEVLQKGGYVSGIFGKWDLGQLHRYLPLQRGFNEFYGFVNTGIDYYTHERYGVGSMYRGNEPTTEDKGTYSTDLFRREALRFLDEHHDEPFFLYVPFNAPHNASSLDPKIRPLAQAPETYLQKYPGPDKEERYKEVEHYRRYDYRDPEMVPTRAFRKQSYKACVTAMDDAIGRILDKLEEHGVAKNTLVVFFSDNGGSGIANNDPLRGHKGQMFEGGLRVPCIIRWPGRLSAGTTNDQFLTSMELLPTLVRAAGLQPPEGVILDGFNMMPVLTGEKTSPRESLFSERLSGHHQMARVGPWKWVRHGGLFHVKKDIGEQKNLAKERPEVLDRLKQRFKQWKSEMDDAENRRPFKNF